eukprot:gene5852-biopygen13385
MKLTKISSDTGSAHYATLLPMGGLGEIGQLETSLPPGVKLKWKVELEQYELSWNQSCLNDLDIPGE